MKIGIDIGHNVSFDRGAYKIKSEDVLNKEVGLMVIDKLKNQGHEVVNCTPTNATSLGNSLYQRVKKANTEKVDIYVSIHFNAGGGTGTEVYAISQKGKAIAARIVEKISSLGYRNRGVKDGSWLYVLKNTLMPAVLVECCFVDSSNDMNMLNTEKMANAIVEGITQEKVVDKVSDSSKITKNTNTVDILKLQKALNMLEIRDNNGNRLVEDGIIGFNTLSAVKKLQQMLQRLI